MSKEWHFNKQKNVYERRMLPLMIMIGISFLVMLLFEGLALTSQLNLFKWLTWIAAVVYAVLTCMMMILLVQLIRLMSRRRKAERKEREQANR